MSDLLQGLNIYLIGMMGAGKTTVGKHLAKELNYRFYDMDRIVEAIAKKPITEIFQTDGEASFRGLETKVLDELTTYTRSVISTGGGIIEKPLNWSYLRQGLVIWLDVDLKILQKRLNRDHSRPLVNKLESLSQIRRSLYAQADLQITINHEQSPKLIATQIVEKIPTVLKIKV